MGASVGRVESDPRRRNARTQPVVPFRRPIVRSDDREQNAMAGTAPASGDTTADSPQERPGIRSICRQITPIGGASVAGWVAAGRPGRRRPARRPPVDPVARCRSPDGPGRGGSRTRRPTTVSGCTLSGPAWRRLRPDLLTIGTRRHASPSRTPASGYGPAGSPTDVVQRASRVLGPGETRVADAALSSPNRPPPPPRGQRDQAARRHISAGTAKSARAGRRAPSRLGHPRAAGHVHAHNVAVIDQSRGRRDPTGQPDLEAFT